MKNKSMFINLVIFGLGLGAGYTLGNIQLRKRYQEASAEVKDFYMNKLQEMGVMEKGFTPEEMIDQIIEDDNEAYEATEEYFNKVKGYSTAIPENDGGQRGKGRPIIKYNKPPLILEEYGSLDDEGDIEEDYDDDEEDAAYEAALESIADELAQRRYENQAKGLPYVISFDEYEDIPEEYEHHSLYYYTVDRVLCEDDDTMVEDEEELVGLDYEDVLEMQTTAWVRNDAILMVYEITRIDESYHESVANAVETPRERDYRIMSRRKEKLDS